MTSSIDAHHNQKVLEYQNCDRYFMMILKQQRIHHNTRHQGFWRNIALIFCLWVLSSSVFANNNQQPQAMYYRYYDTNGIATVSRNVSPTHIRRGYEVLDRNMYVIKSIPAYNVEADLRNESTRAVQSQRNREDQQIKRSFRNIAYATDKKKETLAVTQKQLTQQYQHMRQLQTDRSSFLQQKSDLILEKKKVPTTLQSNLDNNAEHIKNTRATIEQLKNTYATQEQHFDYIISRLQTFE